MALVSMELVFSSDWEFLSLISGRFACNNAIKLLGSQPTSIWCTETVFSISFESGHQQSSSVPMEFITVSKKNTEMEGVLPPLKGMGG